MRPAARLSLLPLVAVAATALLASGCGYQTTPRPSATPSSEFEDGPKASGRRSKKDDEGGLTAAGAERDAPRPTRVSVPAVGISARVIPLGLKRDGTLEVPKNFAEAGWRAGGPEPGERGPALITAHVDSKSGPAAFYKLGSVRRGNVVRVRRRDGSTAAFEVQRTERVSKDAFPTKRVYGKTKGSTLRLVTCGGSFDSSTGHYRDNVIVYARRVRT